MTSRGTYQSLVSPRSRRIRTTGCVFLAAVIAMSVYGYFWLMPGLRLDIGASSVPVAAHAGSGSLPVPPLVASAREAHAAKVRKTKVAVGMAYWGLCLVFTLAALFMAWLDLRETSRNFAILQRKMSADATESLRRQIASRSSDKVDE